MNLQLGKKINRLRIKAGYTQEQLANFCQVSHVAISKWERGITNPDISMLPILARIFDISIDELLSFELTLNDEKIKELVAHAINIFKTDRFEIAFAYCKRLLHMYPNSPLLKIRLAASYISVCMLIFEEDESHNEQLKQYESFATSLCESLIDHPDLRLRQTACIQLCSFYSLNNKSKEAIDLLLSLPKLEDMTLLLCSLYIENKEYQKANIELQKQLYKSFTNDSLIIFSLVNIAIKEHNEKEAEDYLNLLEKRSELFQIDMNNVQIYDFYAQLKNKDKTLFYLTKYVQNLMYFDDLVNDYKNQLTQTTWFQHVQLTKNEALPTRDILKTKIKYMFESNQHLDFIRDTKEYYELMKSIEHVD